MFGFHTDFFQHTEGSRGLPTFLSDFAAPFSSAVICNNLLMRLSASFISPNKIAPDEHAVAQATTTSPSSRSVFFLCGEFASPDALHTERAFFHHATWTHGYIRVHHTTQICVHGRVNGCELLVIVMPSEPVETSYFIRTVVGTITCTDATVIRHLVNPFCAVCSSSHGAYCLHGALLQCWQSMGWNTTSGFSAAFYCLCKSSTPGTVL